MRCRFLAILLILFSQGLQAGIDDGFSALKEYDYFRAKKIFYKELKKHPTESGYGLAIIFFRSDNPFHQLDSAYKYVRMAKNTYPLLKEKTKTKARNFGLTDSILNILEDSIAHHSFISYWKKPNVENAEKFLEIYADSKYALPIRCRRDSLLFEAIKNSANENKISAYLRSYPESCFLEDARRRLEYARYVTITNKKDAGGYLAYIRLYPLTAYTSTAKNELLEFYILHKDADGIYHYIKNIAPSLYAWNALFSLEVNSYDADALDRFLQKYPGYPDKAALEEEAKFIHLELLGIKEKEKTGFADTAGNIIIQAVYEDAEDFSEGFAAAEKNGRFGYISKAGKVKIDFLFEEAASFSGQSAIVKENNGEFLIDHSGKRISSVYDEIASFAEELAIVRKNRLFGAINRKGEEVIKPAFSSLSDFSEGLAAFSKGNKYGFINRQGFTEIVPLFGWVSSFKNGQCRVKTDNLFGVINRRGDFVIQPLYDHVDEKYKGVFLPVKNNLYGFADSSGCFITDLKFTYNPAYRPAQLTNGQLFVLYKNNKAELLNRNGIRLFKEENFAEIILGDHSVFAAGKNKRLMFYSADNKIAALKQVFTSVGYDGIYWYAENSKGISVYDNHLKEKLFTVKAISVRKLGDYFWYETEEGGGILSADGKVLLPAFFDDASPVSSPHIFYIERKEKGAYFDVSALKFIWKEEGFNLSYIAEEE